MDLLKSALTSTYAKTLGGGTQIKNDFIKAGHHAFRTATNKTYKNIGPKELPLASGVAHWKQLARP